jgi:hypothetical protein
MVPTNDDTWLIDSGASSHMIRFRDHLNNIVEKETNLHICWPLTKFWGNFGQLWPTFGLRHIG